MSLHRILYKSTSRVGGSASDVRQGLDDIVRVSAAANAASDLTGALLFAGSVFIQVIEGPMEPLEACFERICCDLRHREVRLLKLAQVDRRAFGQWPMLDIAPPPDLGMLASLLVKASDPDRLAGTEVEAVIAALHELGTRQRAGSMA